MAGSNDGASVLNYPVTSFNFGLEIGNALVAAFTELSGFGASMEVQEYKEGGFNRHTHKFPGRTTFSNVTLKWGMTDNEELWDWYLEVLQGVASAGKSFRRDVSIVSFDVYKSAGSGPRPVARRWNLLGAFPVKWTGPSWNSGQSQAAIETLEFAYRDLDRKA